MINLKRILIIILLLLCSPVLAAVSIEQLTQMAQSGNHKAQNDLGMAYYEGQLVQQNYQKAFYWLNQAASQGDMIAAGNLGLFYENGYNVVSVDYPKAIELFEKGAAAGNIAAMSNLGVMYQNGLGVEKDPNKAYQLFTQAANLGSPLAMYNLGGYFFKQQDANASYKWFKLSADSNYPAGMRQVGFFKEFGVGTNLSYPDAYMWFNLALAHGDKLSQSALNQLLPKMTPDQIAEGKKLLAEAQNTTTSS
jgi:TPR repeat protein